MTEWTPDQPLRADATDEQMVVRFGVLLNGPRAIGRANYYECAAAAFAREFAAACVEQGEAEPAKDNSTTAELYEYLTHAVEHVIQYAYNRGPLVMLGAEATRAGSLAARLLKRLDDPTFNDAARSFHAQFDTDAWVKMFRGSDAIDAASRPTPEPAPDCYACGHPRKLHGPGACGACHCGEFMEDPASVPFSADTEPGAACDLLLSGPRRSEVLSQKGGGRTSSYVDDDRRGAKGRNLRS